MDWKSLNGNYNDILAKQQVPSTNYGRAELSMLNSLLIIMNTKYYQMASKHKVCWSAEICYIHSFQVSKQYTVVDCTALIHSSVV